LKHASARHTIWSWEHVHVGAGRGWRGQTTGIGYPLAHSTPLPRLSTFGTSQAPSLPCSRITGPSSALGQWTHSTTCRFGNITRNEPSLLRALSVKNKKTARAFAALLGLSPLRSRTELDRSKTARALAALLGFFPSFSCYPKTPNPFSTQALATRTCPFSSTRQGACSRPEGPESAALTLGAFT
jgi:hypothetical protein